MAISATEQRKNKIREAAEKDLATFISLVMPQNVMGQVHRDLCSWWQRSDRKDNQIVLLPRDHGKSRYLAFRCAHRITIQPDVRIIYISATSGLAQAQLAFIKQILTSDIYRRYWPDMVNEQESKREQWTNDSICVDHPKRGEEAVRDPTILTGGLTTGLTGRHCDVMVMDDIVVMENTYTEEGRQKVKNQYSMLTSIKSTDSETWVVGTRYDSKDLYGEMLQMQEPVFDDEGNEIGREDIYEVFEKPVENVGDGSGEFLWPRQQRADGKWFGFDRSIYERKKAEYPNRLQFRAQYYNDPNDPGDLRIDRSKFQYYEKNFLRLERGQWTINGRRLNLFASIDFAYSLGDRSDYTALVVIGVDSNNHVYVLEIKRFKTTRIADYFKAIQETHDYWKYRKLAAEVTAAQKAIVEELKNQYIVPNGLNLSIEEIRPTRHQGSKEERISATLEPRYDNMSIWHYKDGNCQLLEEELMLDRPPHDDISDALTTAINISSPPSQMRFGKSSEAGINVVSHPRFGGLHTY